MSVVNPKPIRTKEYIYQEPMRDQSTNKQTDQSAGKPHLLTDWLRNQCDFFTSISE